MDKVDAVDDGRSHDMALQRRLRELLLAAGYARPLDIRYIRRGNGEAIDAATVYGRSETNDEPALGLYVVEEDEWVCAYERE